MNIEFTHCVFFSSDSSKSRIEKPGVITISANSIVMDDFVFDTGDGSFSDSLELIRKWIEQRIDKIRDED